MNNITHTIKRNRWADWSQSAIAGRLLCTALQPLLKNVADTSMLFRLNRLMRQVIMADTSNPMGYRNVVDGKLALLEGFEFNAGWKFPECFCSAYHTCIDRAAGRLTLQAPACVPAKDICFPADATHCCLVAAGLEINFMRKLYVTGNERSGVMAAGQLTTVPLNLCCQVTPGSFQPLLLVMGLEFYRQVNADLCPLNKGKWNALTIANINSG